MLKNVDTIHPWHYSVCMKSILVELKYMSWVDHDLYLFRLYICIYIYIFQPSYIYSYLVYLPIYLLLSYILLY